MNSTKAIVKKWGTKRASIYRLKDNINKLKYHVKTDLSYSKNEKKQLTALVVRTMLYTSERVGNEDSAQNGHFGVTQFKNKHIKIDGNRITLNYIGKSGVRHKKSYIDKSSAGIFKKLLKINKGFIFITSNGFRIRPDKVNRYLNNFGAKSKDIRGFNANRLMVMELERMGHIDKKERPKKFNEALRKIGDKIGHGAPTLRKHYLLPEIEEKFYKEGSVKNIKMASGGEVKGRSHKQGGVPMLNKGTGQTYEVEGGEFIVCKSSMNDKKKRRFYGTNKQVVSKVNLTAGCNPADDYKKSKTMKKGGSVTMKHDKKYYKDLSPIDGYKWQGFWDGYHHFVKRMDKGYMEVRATDRDIEDGNLKDMIEMGFTKAKGGSTYAKGRGIKQKPLQAVLNKLLDDFENMFKF